MKKLNLNKKVIATLNDPNKITGGLTFTSPLLPTCEGHTCEGLIGAKTQCTCEITDPVEKLTKTCQNCPNNIR